MPRPCTAPAASRIIRGPFSSPATPRPMTDFIFALLGAALVNNLILGLPLGADSLRQPRSQALALAGGTLIVLATPLAWLLDRLLLAPLDRGALLQRAALDRTLDDVGALLHGTSSSGWTGAPALRCSGASGLRLTSGAGEPTGRAGERRRP